MPGLLHGKQTLPHQTPFIDYCLAFNESQRCVFQLPTSLSKMPIWEMCGVFFTYILRHSSQIHQSFSHTFILQPSLKVSYSSQTSESQHKHMSTLSITFYPGAVVCHREERNNFTVLLGRGLVERIRDAHFSALLHKDMEFKMNVLWCALSIWETILCSSSGYLRPSVLSSPITSKKQRGKVSSERDQTDQREHRMITIFSAVAFLHQIIPLPCRSFFPLFQIQ